MIYYEDLLSVPFKLGGRDKNGMDCYGLVLECCRRNGTELVDLSCVHVCDVGSTVQKINVIEIAEPYIREGNIIQCLWAGELHIGYLLDKKTVIHATYDGVRVNSILAFRDKKFYKVV